MTGTGPFALIAAGLVLLLLGLLALHGGRTSGPRLAVLMLASCVAAMAFMLAQAAVFPTFHDRYDTTTQDVTP